MIAKGFTPRNDPKVFAIMENTLRLYGFHCSMKPR
jgi:hypothetical protein